MQQIRYIASMISRQQRQQQHNRNLWCQVVEQAKLDDWKVSEGLVLIATRMFSTIGGTKLVEDSFQLGRQAEGKGGNQNHKMHPATFFDKLITSNLASSIHNYHPLPWEGASIPRGEKDKPVHDLFATRFKDASPQLKQCPGIAQNPAWWSPSPVNQSQQDVDTELALHCHRHGCWELAQYSWLCILLRGHSMVVKNAASNTHDGGTSGWMFYVGDVQGVAALLWPAKAVQCGGETCYTLDPDHAMKPMPLGFILDLDCWLAMRVEWLSPLGVACQAAADSVPSPGAACHSILALPAGEPMGLLKAVAYRAFGDITRVGLLAIAKHIAAPWDPGDHMYDRLHKIIRHVLPTASEDVILDIMRLRVHEPTALETFLVSGEADCIMAEDDLKSVKQMAEKHQKSETDRKVYARIFRAAGTKARLAKEGASTAGKGKKRRRKELERPTEVRLEPNITVAGINDLLPDNFRCWYDRWNNRWQLYHHRRRVRNYSFHAYGVLGAARSVVTHAWHLNEAYGGASMPYSLVST